MLGKYISFFTTKVLYLAIYHFCHYFHNQTTLFLFFSSFLYLQQSFGVYFSLFPNLRSTDALEVSGDDDIQFADISLSENVGKDFSIKRLDFYQGSYEEVYICFDYVRNLEFPLSCWGPCQERF